MIKRSELVDPRMMHTPIEIALYNSSAYYDLTKGMTIIKDSDKWVPPNLGKILNV